MSLKANNAATPAPRPASRIDHIDGLRAAACLIVVLHHSWMLAKEPQMRLPILGHHLNIMRLLQVGNTGVHLFLLLSGFCLFYSFAAPGADAKFNLKRFAVKRCWRILPAYYAACIVGIALPYLLAPITRSTGAAFELPHAPGLLSLLLHTTLLHGFYAPALYDINGVFWSLSLEWQFYFTFPFLLWAFHKKGPFFTVALVAIVNIVYRVVVFRYFVIAKPGYNSHDWALCSSFLGRWLEFTLGMLAAWQLARRARQETKGRFGLFVAVALLFAGLGLYRDFVGHFAPYGPLDDILWGISYYFWLRAALIQDSPLQRMLSLRPVVWLGGISYSVYLMHMPLLMILAPLLPHRPGQPVSIYLLAIVELILIIPISYGFYKLFEEPFMNRVRSHIKTSSAQ